MTEVEKIDMLVANAEWLRSGIAVNGSRGLEDILKTHHADIKELKRITEPERSREALIKAVKLFARSHPVLATIAGIILTAAGSTFGKELFQAIVKFHIG